MTAAELFEVVKDVPREAWPELTWDGVEWSNSKRDEDISARIAEHAFIGSMTAFKARQFETVVYNREGTTKHIVSQGVTEWEGDSIVAALAAACKEAA